LNTYFGQVIEFAGLPAKFATTWHHASGDRAVGSVFSPGALEVWTRANASSMRRGEVGGLKWSYITENTITLPPSLTKNKSEHVLPNLIGDELTLVPKAKRLDGEVCEYLFPSSVFTPYSTCSDGKKALDALCGVTDFAFHDFRRCLSTAMAKLRVPIDVTEAILNLVSGSRSPIQRVYDRYDRLPEMRETLQLYTKRTSPRSSREAEREIA
jgi:integrase